jgi:hypothetical protein
MRHFPNSDTPLTRSLAAPSYRPQLLNSLAPGRSLLAALRETEPGPHAPDAHAPDSQALDAHARASHNHPAPDRPNPIVAPDQAAATEARQVALIAAEPQVQRDIAQFTEALANARTPARLLADHTALKVLLTANGMADRIGDTDLAARALLSDPSQPGSLVNQLADKRWLSVNKTYCFAAKGLAVLEHLGVVAAIAGAYAEALWRKRRDQTTSGPSMSQDVPRHASTLGDVDQVAAGAASRGVVSTALGVPQPIAGGAGDQAGTARTGGVMRPRNPAFVNQPAPRHPAASQPPASHAGGDDPANVANPAEPAIGLGG